MTIDLMTFDLSSITDALIDLVSSQWSSAPIWTELSSGGFTNQGPVPNFSGFAPDAARQQAGPQLCLYLYHVETNHATESLFWQSQSQSDSTGEPVRFLPMALDVYYLLYSYSEDSWIEEQQLMSVALRIFHANPIVRSSNGSWELTLTPEHRSYDELSRLWQATTTPLRMSLVYRASVVFLNPDQMPQAPNLTESVNVSVNLLEPADPPILVTTARQLSYLDQTNTTVSETLSPATVAPGQTLQLIGNNLAGSGASNVFLLDGSGNLVADVTSWMLPASSTPTQVSLQFPQAVGAAPTATPPPGIYQIQMGSGSSGAVGSTRSQTLPLAVAAAVDTTGGPVLSGTGPFTVDGAGFTAGQTQVQVGSTTLTETTTSPPQQGEILISADGTSFTFSPPTGTTTTPEAISVQVSQVISDPALWVTP